jgi:demethylmenaquinone methyltransferase/2-methoxy-6-polyprenyl-1,4-benzoquinol methylase
MVVEPTNKVLDVGGGTGRVIELFKPITRQAVVADSARNMLKQAIEKGIDCVETLSERLPFAEGTFDRIVLVDALHHVIDQQQTLNEMWRLLAPGGKIIIEEGDINHWMVKLVSWGEKLLLMRSHFISPEQIVSMCRFNPTVKIEIVREKVMAWIIISKNIDTIEGSYG